MTAKEVIQLLANRHSDDVFVPECKDGPTWNGEHLRLDAWAMRKSWSRPCCWGYEVKVTRRDFVQDAKSHAYLQLCNEFYFVAPKGLIQEQELPDGAGLLVVAGSRLVCKRKAAHRDIVIPDSLWRYLLMSRCVITDRVGVIRGDPEAEKRGRVERYRTWAEDATIRKSLAGLIGAKISSRMNELSLRNDRLMRYRKATRVLEKKLVELGINPDDPDWLAEHRIGAAVKRLRGDLDHVDREARNCIKAVNTLLARISEAGKPLEEEAA